ncbi:hypothetical protein LEN26_012203, partial [Aphanomyces euteiches]
MNRQAFLNAQIMDQAVVVLADTGANMSIIHPSIVKRLGLEVDTTKTTDISGLGGAAVVNTQGIVDIKLTIGRGLVYVFPIAVCDFGNTGFDAILGMDFLFRAGVMVDASRRELNLPEGEYVELHDQPVRYSRGYMNYVRLNRDVNIPPGGSVVVPLPKLREGMPETLEYWVHRDVRWITTALNSENKPAAYKVTNVSERNVSLSAHTVVGAISAQGERPLDRPMVRTSSLRYRAWKAEALEGSYPDDYRARLDEAAAELTDDGSWKGSRPPSPRHLLTADGELRETCEVDDDRSEGDRRPSADQTAVDPGVSPCPMEAGKPEIPAVFCYRACHFRDTLPPPSILLMDAVPDNLDQRRMAKEVVLREGIDLSTEELEQQLAIFPEVPREAEPFDPDQLDVGEDELSDDEKEKMRVVLRKYRKFFIKSGNGLPPPAKGAVCDIDVGEAKPLAERARRIRPELLKKLFDLLRGLLDFGLITFSNSPWASPIVLVLKKGGKDIRLSIDYRGINELQELIRSPMPTLDGMLANFHAMQWFLSLDNASGFWVVRATERARKVSAFICALGHFEWTRMAQGLKNAPMIYQRMTTNALFGFVDMPPVVADEDADGEPVDMFALGFKCDLSQLPPPANRTSFADDISDGADSWEGIVELTDRILARLTYFGMSISALKSKFGKIATDFLSHVVSRRGLEARPRSPDAVLAAPFPKCLRDMQSFLGSLNFYSRFIENYSILAHCHDDAQGGHAKFQRTYERARAHFYWRLMYADTKDYVADCAICNTAGPPPNFRALSPGNLTPEGPLDVVCMDTATDMPSSFRGNTQLIVFADVFTGFIMTKATPNRTAHTVALAFEEVVFRRFGACRELRHDRDPSFMSN